MILYSREWFRAQGAERRIDEMQYRREGRFEKAVELQRQADILEQGDCAVYRIASWLDRGAQPMPIMEKFDEFMCVTLPSGLTYMMTEDMARELQFGIHCYLSERSSTMGFREAADLVIDWLIKREKKP